MSVIQIGNRIFKLSGGVRIPQFSRTTGRRINQAGAFGQSQYQRMMNRQRLEQTLALLEQAIAEKQLVAGTTPSEAETT